MDRAMMLALNGRESDVDPFPYVLAERLHCTLRDIDAMPWAEYLGWASYMKVKSTIEEQRGRHASAGS